MKQLYLLAAILLTLTNQSLAKRGSEADQMAGKEDAGLRPSGIAGASPGISEETTSERKGINTRTQKICQAFWLGAIQLAQQNAALEIRGAMERGEFFTASQAQAIINDAADQAEAQANAQLKKAYAKMQEKVERTKADCGK